MLFLFFRILDALDWIVTFICFLLAILCIWATVFEFLNRRKSQDINYYKKPLKTPCKYERL